MIDIRVGWKYRLGRKLGSGPFGDVYQGLNIQNDEEVAIKLEKHSKKVGELQYESKTLKSLQCSQGVPNIYWYGSEGSFNAMVIELLGPSLQKLFAFAHYKFSLKTVLMVADQLLSRLETVHTKNFIHRNIKPTNFLIGLGKKSNIFYLVNFGLSKQYRDSKTHKHIPYNESRNLIGTSRYASINNHLGVELSRRDDLESIGYVLLYFLTGCLPWQGRSCSDREEKYKIIKEIKLNTSVEQLCDGVPGEFNIYLNYCRGLKFDERPDYPYLKKLFKDLFIKEMFEYDNIYDWTVLNYIKPLQLENYYKETQNVFNNEESKIHASVEVHAKSKSIEEIQSPKKCIIF